MPDFSILGDGQAFELEGVDTANSVLQAVTASATPNAKGAWTQLGSATTYEYSALLVESQTGTTATTATSLIDIGIGGSGSQQVVIPNLLHSRASSSAYFVNSAVFPIAVPKGSTLWARAQSSSASQISRVGVTGIAAGMLPSSALQRVTAIGVNTGSSTGTQIDPGGTINTKGAWTQLVASAAAPLRALVIATATAAHGTNGNILLDIGIGGSGSEHVLIPNLAFIQGNNTGSTFYFLPQLLGSIPVDIPAGTRISARAQCTINLSGQREILLALYGID